MKKHRNIIWCLSITLILFILLFLVPKLSHQDISLSEESGDKQVLKDQIFHISMADGTDGPFDDNFQYRVDSYEGKTYWNCERNYEFQKAKLLGQVSPGQRFFHEDQINFLSNQKGLVILDSYYGEGNELPALEYVVIDFKTGQAKKHSYDPPVYRGIVTLAEKDGKAYLLMHDYENYDLYRLVIDIEAQEVLSDERIEIEGINPEKLTPSVYSYQGLASHWLVEEYDDRPYSSEGQKKLDPAEVKREVFVVDPESTQVNTMEISTGSAQVSADYLYTIEKDQAETHLKKIDLRTIQEESIYSVSSHPAFSPVVKMGANCYSFLYKDDKGQVWIRSFDYEKDQEVFSGIFQNNYKDLEITFID